MNKTYKFEGKENEAFISKEEAKGIFLKILNKKIILFKNRKKIKTFNLGNFVDEKKMNLQWIRINEEASKNNNNYLKMIYKLQE